MIFEPLWDSAQRGELILIDGGFCHWHLRKDGQLTIREIIGTRKGAGTEMLNLLKIVHGAKFILAKCPTDLASNAWYQKKGFRCVRVETTLGGRTLNVWRLELG